MGQKSRIRRAISRWANSAEQDLRDLRATHTADDLAPISEIHERSRVRLQGNLRTLTLRPLGGVPALEGELDDGTGTIALVWLGRRHIVGIETGRDLRVEGRVGAQEGRLVIFNPRYELLP